MNSRIGGSCGEKMAKVLMPPLSCTAVCHTAFEVADCSESSRGGGLSLCQRESD